MIPNDKIREILVEHGFKLHEIDGAQDLKQYVYEAAHALIALAQEVPDLEWDDDAGFHLWSQAFVDSFGNDEDEESYLVFDQSSSCNWFLDPPFDAENIGPFKTKDEAKAAANEHNRKRILSQLKYGGDK